MTANAATLPQARGVLATTSIAELLVLALERRLDGSLVFETPLSDKSALVVASGRVTKVRTAQPIGLLGRLLTDSGMIDRATLDRGLHVAQERKDRLGDALVQLGAVARDVIERTLREQLGRRLSWLADLPEESAFGFYANVDFLEDHPACGVEPLSLIWRCLRDGRSAPPRQEAALSALRSRPLGLRARAALDRFDLSASERACIESLSARPLALDALIAQTGLDDARARRLIYALLITHQLGPQPSPGMAAPRMAAPSPPPSVPRDSATAAALRPSSPPPLPARSASPRSRSAPGRASVPPEPSASTSHSRPPERVEHALELASRGVRERARAEGAAEATRVMDRVREHMAKKQYADAERLARTACNADPGNAEHLALHAWLRMQVGELAVPGLTMEIVSALEHAVMKAPMSVPVRFYRAQVLKRLGRADEAYKDFRFVARRAPDQLDAVREVRLHLIRTRDKSKQSGVFSKLFLR
jgi:tetratricopeptide (TPR) repeat protein